MIFRYIEILINIDSRLCKMRDIEQTLNRIRDLLANLHTNSWWYSNLNNSGDGSEDDSQLTNLIQSVVDFVEANVQPVPLPANAQVNVNSVVPILDSIAHFYHFNESFLSECLDHENFLHPGCGYDDNNDDNTTFAEYANQCLSDMFKCCVSSVEISVFEDEDHFDVEWTNDDGTIGRLPYHLRYSISDPTTLRSFIGLCFRVFNEIVDVHDANNRTLRTDDPDFMDHAAVRQDQSTLTELYQQFSCYAAYVCYYILHSMNGDTQ